MADIDMIPRSYREGLRVQRLLRHYAVALAALLLLSVGTAGALRWQVARMEPRLAALRDDAARNGTDSARLAALQARQVALAQHVAALAALRGAGNIRQLAGALHHALRPELWLVGLRYARNEQLVPAQASEALRAGELQVQAGAVAERWRIGRRLDLNGGALTYPALTAFMHDLAEQEVASDVQLVDSSSPDAAGGAIGFNLSARIGAGGAKP